MILTQSNSLLSSANHQAYLQYQTQTLNVSESSPAHPIRPSSSSSSPTNSDTNSNYAFRQIETSNNQSYNGRLMSKKFTMHHNPTSSRYHPYLNDNSYSNKTENPNSLIQSYSSLLPHQYPLDVLMSNQQYDFSNYSHSNPQLNNFYPNSAEFQQYQSYQNNSYNDNVNNYYYGATNLLIPNTNQLYSSSSSTSSLSSTTSSNQLQAQQSDLYNLNQHNYNTSVSEYPNNIPDQFVSRKRASEFNNNEDTKSSFASVSPGSASVSSSSSVNCKVMKKSRRNLPKSHAQRAIIDNQD